MTLRPEYSLGHSQYNDFLFAAVGEDKGGMPLTVLTALTRLGLDPWLEAARLSDLPKEGALKAFAATIAKLPEGDWKVSESEAIAARLLHWLPGRSAAAIPPVAAARRGAQKMISTPAAKAAPLHRGNRQFGLSLALMWVALAAVFIFLILNVQTDNNLESSAGTDTTTQP